MRASPKRYGIAEPSGAFRHAAPGRDPTAHTRACPRSASTTAMPATRSSRSPSTPGGTAPTPWPRLLPPLPSGGFEAVGSWWPFVRAICAAVSRPRRRDGFRVGFGSWTRKGRHSTVCWPSSRWGRARGGCSGGPPPRRQVVVEAPNDRCALTRYQHPVTCRWRGHARTASSPPPPEDPRAPPARPCLCSRRRPPRSPGAPSSRRSGPLPTPGRSGGHLRSGR